MYEVMSTSNNISFWTNAIRTNIYLGLMLLGLLLSGLLPLLCCYILLQNILINSYYGNITTV